MGSESIEDGIQVNPQQLSVGDADEEGGRPIQLHGIVHGQFSQLHISLLADFGSPLAHSQEFRTSRMPGLGSGIAEESQRVGGGTDNAHAQFLEGLHIP